MTERIEYGTKAAADQARDKHVDWLCSEDDKRLKTVAFSSDTPEHVLEQERLQAQEGRGERSEGAGQVALSDHEKDQIDWSEGRASVPHARSVKGIAAAEGVDDWMAYYDPTLTVDEHRDVMERAARESGRQTDTEDVEQRAAEAAKAAQSEQCDHARDHCKRGDPDACEFLTEACGFEDEEVDAILDDGEEIPGRISGALSQLWTRYQIGLANAKEAAAAINEINRQYDRDLTTFEELGDRELTPDNISWETAS